MALENDLSAQLLAEQNEESQYRNVGSKEISQSFRGILRISPTSQGEHGFLTEEDDILQPVSDSVGNFSALSLSQNKVGAKNLILSGTLSVKNADEEEFSIDISKPNKDDILLGTENSDYEKANLVDFLNNFVRDKKILAQLVPVGTIIHVAMNTFGTLPEPYTDFYKICDGSTVNSTDYPELANLMGKSGQFNLPDLRNKFIRGASNKADNLLNSDKCDSITIPPHAPLSTEVPATNLYALNSTIKKKNINPFFSATSVSAGTAFFKHDTDREVFKTTSSQRSYLTGTGAGWFDVKISMNVEKLLGFEEGDIPTDTHPYNISLVPLIKVK